MTEFDNINPFDTPMSVGGQRPEGNTIGSQSLDSLPFGSWINPELPRDRTLREMSLQNALKPNMDIGFFGKVANAFSGETVTGELIREIGGNNSYADTGWRPTQESVEKYAGDLGKEISWKVARSSDSFAEFLYEADQARLTIKRRKELFSGGPVGTGIGLGLTILAAGGEAVLLTMLTAGLGGAMAGTAAATRAGTATVTALTRVRGSLKGLGIALAVDIPLETTRQHLDKTLNPGYALMAIGASAGITTTLGAVKPNMFLRQIQSIGDDAVTKEAARLAREAGHTKSAAYLESKVAMKTDVTPIEAVHPEAYVNSLSRKEVFHRAKEAGINVERDVTALHSTKKLLKSTEQVRRELIDHLQSVSPRAKKTRASVELEWGKLKTAAERAKYAEELGVKSSVIRAGGKKLKKAVMAKVDEVIKTGRIRKGVIPKLPKGLRLKKSATILRKSWLVSGGVKIKFKSNVEAALWTLVRGRNPAKNAELRAWLKGTGIDDVDALAKQFVRDVEFRATKVKSPKGLSGTKVVDDAGKPVTVFHGGSAKTIDDIDVKDTSRAFALSGRGIYASTKQTVAKGYVKGKGKVHEVMLNIKKPFIRGESKWGPKAMAILRKAMAKEVDDNWAKHEIARLGNKHLYESAVGPDVITKMLRAEGFDGVKDGHIWVALDKSQLIKPPKLDTIDIRTMGPIDRTRVGRTSPSLRPLKVREGKPLERGQGLFETDTPHTFKIDDELVEGEFPRTPDDPRIHPMEEPDSVVSVNGKPVAEGPEADMIHVDESAMGLDPGRYTVTGHPEGIRETLARAIDLFPGNIPGLRGAYKAFAPLTLRLLAMKSPLVRKWANTILENPRGGNINNVHAIAAQNTQVVLLKLQRGIKDAMDKADKIGDKLTNTQIVRAVRSGKEFDGPLGDAVKAMREFHSNVLKYGQEGGLFTGAIPQSDKYMSRVYNSAMFTKLVDEFGEDEVVKFFAQSIMKHEGAAASKITLKKAEATARRIVEYGTNPNAARDWRGTQILFDKMRTKLQEEGIPKEQVDELLDAVIPHVDRQPHISYGRRRIDLNESYEASITSSKTGAARQVHIDEFFDNNIVQNTQRYAQRIIGGVEMRKAFKALFGDDNITINDVLHKLGESANKAGDDASFIVKTAEHAYRGATGQTIYKDPQTMRWVMGANSFGQATIGHTLGFAQLTEIASVVARSGFRSALQQFPGIRETAHIFTMGLRDLATGRRGLGLRGLAKDDFAATLETFTGVGSGDYIRGDHFMRRLDDLGFDDDLARGGVNRWLDYGRQAAALGPLGIIPMDTFLRRWAVKSSFQHFVNQAYKVGKGGKVTLNKGFWNNSKQRFREIGMSEESLDELNRVLMDTSIVELRSGMFGRYTVKNINLEKLKNQAIFDQFAISLRKHVNHMVQRQSYGETPAWMNTQMGKLLGQYRVFMMASKSKQLASGMARGDAIEATNVVMGAGIAMIAYQLQTYYRSAGMEPRDRRRYLRDKFRTDKMIKAGIMKGSYSTIFPMLIDSSSWILGGEPVFDPSMRTTGLGIDPLTGSVPYSILYGRAFPAGRELTGALFRGDRMSKNDIRNIQSLIWMGKLPGIDQAINQLTNKLNIPQKDN